MYAYKHVLVKLAAQEAKGRIVCSKQTPENVPTIYNLALRRKEQFTHWLRRDPVTNLTAITPSPPFGGRDFFLRPLTRYRERTGNPPGPEQAGVGGMDIFSRHGQPRPNVSAAGPFRVAPLFTIFRQFKHRGSPPLPFEYPFHSPLLSRGFRKCHDARV